jgi:uncharacterized protein YbaR (Trm112 family)
MAIAEELLKILVCPADHAPVRLVQEGAGLQCDQCRRVYPIRDGIPVMLMEEASQDSSPARD